MKETNINSNKVGQSQVYSSPNQKTFSWVFGKSQCLVQTSDPKIAEKINSWKFTKPFAKCLTTTIRLFSIPRRKWRWVNKRLGIIGPDKNPKKVVQGLKQGRENLNKECLGHEQENLKAPQSDFFDESVQRVGL